MFSQSCGLRASWHSLDLTLLTKGWRKYVNAMTVLSIRRPTCSAVWTDFARRCGVAICLLLPVFATPMRAPRVVERGRVGSGPAQPLHRQSG
jgi:hypothetical protein